MDWVMWYADAFMIRVSLKRFFFLKYGRHNAEVVIM